MPVLNNTHHLHVLDTPHKHSVYIKACFACSKRWDSLLLLTQSNVLKCDCGVILGPDRVQVFRKEIQVPRGDDGQMLAKSVLKWWRFRNETRRGYVTVITNDASVFWLLSIQPLIMDITQVFVGKTKKRLEMEKDYHRDISGRIHFTFSSQNLQHRGVCNLQFLSTWQAVSFWLIIFEREKRGLLREQSFIAATM